MKRKKQSQRSKPFGSQSASFKRGLHTCLQVTYLWVDPSEGGVILVHLEVDFSGGDGQSPPGHQEGCNELGRAAQDHWAYTKLGTHNRMKDNIYVELIEADNTHRDQCGTNALLAQHCAATWSGNKNVCSCRLSKKISSWKPRKSLNVDTTMGGQKTKAFEPVFVITLKCIGMGVEPDGFMTASDRSANSHRYQ